MTLQTLVFRSCHDDKVFILGKHFQVSCRFYLQYGNQMSSITPLLLLSTTQQHVHIYEGFYKTESANEMAPFTCTPTFCGYHNQVCCVNTAHVMPVTLVDVESRTKQIRNETCHFLEHKWMPLHHKYTCTCPWHSFVAIFNPWFTCAYCRPLFLWKACMHVMVFTTWWTKVAIFSSVVVQRRRVWVLWVVTDHVSKQGLSTM